MVQKGGLGWEQRSYRGAEWSGAGAGGPGIRWVEAPSLPDAPVLTRGSSSRDKDRSATVSSSVPMPAGGKGSHPSSTPQRVPNRLIHEKSPYLLQHAYNPVDW